MGDYGFEAMEFQRDGRSMPVGYRFLGSEQEGWQILREGHPYLDLDQGFVAVENHFCGICATDLARASLPYPLPQVIGHEVVGRYAGKVVAIEINAGHCGRQCGRCAFCSQELGNHCPERLTLGIDRLPGGFAPWLLAPETALVAVPKGVTSAAAGLTEPLAAALQALAATPPRNGDRVAVLGPRRLGMLLLAALVGFRRRWNLDFEINALARHGSLLELAAALGVDRAVDTSGWVQASPSYDLVFDTTGSADGFALALSLARRVLHVKSTNGRPVMGLDHFYALVVDELALLPLAEPNLDWAWPGGPVSSTRHVYVSPALPSRVLTGLPRRGFRYYRMPRQEAWRKLAEAQAGRADFPPGASLPRFDLAVAASLSEVGGIVRPEADLNWGLVRPRGAVLLAETAGDSPLSEAICKRGLQLHTSRCGNFTEALALLRDNPVLASVLEERLITHRFPLADLAHAFTVAADSRRSIKVMVAVGNQT